MKRLLLVALFFFVFKVVNAQNTFPATGNVGIGTNTPTSRLHILDNTRNYYVDRGIPGYTKSAEGVNYILLHEVYSGTYSADRFVMGKITGIRGGETAGNRKWTVEVNTSTAYDFNRGTMISYNEPSKLVTLTFGGKNYLALHIENAASLYYFSFTGYAGNETLQLITSTGVTNVQDFTSIDVIGIPGDVTIGNSLALAKARLDITGGPTWTTNNWAKSVKMANGGAFELAGTGRSFGMGVSGSILFYFNANVDGTGASNYYMRADGTTGNVGIGADITSPVFKLDVNGITRSVGPVTFIGPGTVSDNNSTTKRGLFVDNGANTAWDLLTLQNTSGTQLRIAGNGNVGIGTLNPLGYKLAVEGTIASRKVKVTQETWADFVFHHDYKLPTLNQVSAFIQQYQHLPGIPSAKEVKENGLDLGEMNKLLLQKVEELTLYMIEFKEENEKLKQRIATLENNNITTKE